MTLPPTGLGDRGQRFEVRATGYPNDGENVIGWSNSDEGAERMMKAIKLAPGCTDAWIVDRGDPMEAADVA